MSGLEYQEAQRIMPPNMLKQKIGSGGIAKDKLANAQTILDNNTIDFPALAEKWLNALEVALLADIDEQQNKKTFEAVLVPVAKLKEHGMLCHYPIVTSISGILLDLLEVEKNINPRLMKIVSAYKLAVTGVIHHDLKGKPGPQGKEIIDSLLDAINRYYKRPAHT